MELDKKILKIIQLKNNLNKLYRRIIEQNKDSWEMMLANDQMYEQGIDGNENKIGEGFYSKKTLKIKQEKGQRTDHITLRDTEKFHNSISLQLDNSGITTIAPGAEKDDGNLMDIYGEDIIKLTDKNKDKLIENIYIPSLTQIIKNEYL
jgi:hypothetical protein